jgi:hypothetical protein
MTKSTRGRYTLEFKQESARLVESGQSQSVIEPEPSFTPYGAVSINTSELSTVGNADNHTATTATSFM